MAEGAQPASAARTIPRATWAVFANYISEQNWPTSELSYIDPARERLAVTHLTSRRPADVIYVIRSPKRRRHRGVPAVLISKCLPLS